MLLAMAAGFIVGVLFSFLKLPIPAPPVLSGVMGIVGLSGGIAYSWILTRFFSLSAFQRWIFRVWYL